MKARRGWVQGYNVQAVVTPRQIILASEVTTEANDVQQLDTSRNADFLMVRLESGAGAEVRAAGPRGRAAV